MIRLEIITTLNIYLKKKQYFNDFYIMTRMSMFTDATKGV